MTQAEAADLLGISRQAVQAAVKRGSLATGREWRDGRTVPADITPEAVERYRRVSLGRYQGQRWTR